MSSRILLIIPAGNSSYVFMRQLSALQASEKTRESAGTQPIVLADSHEAHV